MEKTPVQSTLWALSLMYICYQYGLVVYLDSLPASMRESRGMSLTAMGVCRSASVRRAGRLWVEAGSPDLLYRRSGNVTKARRLVVWGSLLIAAAGHHPGHPDQQSILVRGV